MSYRNKPPITVAPFNLAQLPEGVAVINDPRLAINALEDESADIALVNARAMVDLLDKKQFEDMQLDLLCTGKLWSVMRNWFAPYAAPTFNTTVEALKRFAPTARESEKRIASARVLTSIHLDPEYAVNVALRKRGRKTYFLMPAVSRARYGIMKGPFGSDARAQASDNADRHPIFGAARDVAKGDVTLHETPDGYFPIFAAGRVGHTEPAEFVDEADNYTRRIDGPKPVRSLRYLASYRTREQPELILGNA